MSIDYTLPTIDNKRDVLPIDGKHGVCRSYYQPDILDISALQYAFDLIKRNDPPVYALDLGCSPYFPQSQRFARLGCAVDAIDLEAPVDNFSDINACYGNKINYYISNLNDISHKKLRNDYQIIYSNRCLSFMNYSDTRKLLEFLNNNLIENSRFFVNFFSTTGHYAENYPIDSPLKDRFFVLNSEVAKRSFMLAPVCLYTLEEIENNLLSGLSIKLIDALDSKTGSHKLIMEKY